MRAAAVQLNSTADRDRNLARAEALVRAAAADGATLVALAFAMSTFERWLARRRPHELMWSIALLMFAIAAAALAAGAGTGWNGPIWPWLAGTRPRRPRSPTSP